LLYVGTLIRQLLLLIRGQIHFKRRCGTVTINVYSFLGHSSEMRSAVASKHSSVGHQCSLATSIAVSTLMGEPPGEVMRCCIHTSAWPRYSAGGR
jgi:hypothetical protein